MTSEEWRTIPDIPRYEASSLGRIRRRGHRPLKLQVNRDGYLWFAIKKDGRKTSRLVANCVCAAFHGAPEPGHEPDHRNRDRKDNTPGNLRWLPRLINRGLAVRPVGEERPNAKLSRQKVKEIRLRYVPGDSKNGQRALAAEFGVSRTVVQNVIHHRTWKAKSRAQELREVFG